MAYMSKSHLNEELVLIAFKITHESFILLSSVMCLWVKICDKTKPEWNLLIEYVISFIFNEESTVLRYYNIA